MFLGHDSSGRRRPAAEAAASSASPASPLHQHHHLDPSADATSLSEMSTASTMTPIPTAKFSTRSRKGENAAESILKAKESRLVLETVECGLRRHYLIPKFQSSTRRGNGRRRKRSGGGGGTRSAAELSKALIKSLKGTKLHLAMEHVFVARNIKR